MTRRTLIKRALAALASVPVLGKCFAGETLKPVRLTAKPLLSQTWSYFDPPIPKYEQGVATLSIESMQRLAAWQGPKEATWTASEEALRIISEECPE